MKAALIISATMAVVAIGLQTASALSPQTPTPAPAPKSPYDDIQKVFDKSCIKCHGATRPADGIDLTKYETVIKGGSDGPVIVKGNAAKSSLYLAITESQGYGPMPPRGPKLADKDIKAIEAWIKDGAKK
jgi:mono/diheme cytochrome c family protein